MSQPDETKSAREAYLANQQAVATRGTRHRRLSPFLVVTLVLAILTIALFVAAVVSYYNNPQESGPTDDTLPTLASIAFVATAYSVALPYLIEARTIAKRVRNLVLAAIPAVVLALFGVAIMISLASLVGDLIYNVGH